MKPRPELIYQCKTLILSRLEKQKLGINALKDAVKNVSTEEIIVILFPGGL